MVWAWVARRVPGGWGGGAFLRYPDRDPAFYMKRPAARDSLVAGLAAIAGAQIQLYMFRTGTVLLARWDFAELYDWSVYIHRELGGSYSVIGWDINEGANRIQLTIDIKHPEDVPRLAARLRELGVPCFLIAYELQSIPVALM